MYRLVLLMRRVYTLEIDTVFKNKMMSNRYLCIPFELIGSAPPGFDLLEIFLLILCQQNSTYFAYVGTSILPVNFGWLQYFNDIFDLNKSLVAAGPSLSSNSSLQERRFPLAINSIDGKFKVVESFPSSSFFVRTEELKRLIAEHAIVKSGAYLSFSETESLKYELGIISAVEMIDFEIMAVDPIQLLQAFHNSVGFDRILPLAQDSYWPNN